MRKHFIVAFTIAGLGVFVAHAQPANSRPLSPEDRAQYVKLCQSECELNSQIRVLTELGEEHAKRGGEASNAGAAEKAKWEGELAQELRGKSTGLLGQLNEATKQRLAFETSHGPVPAAVVGGGALEEGKNYNADESLYLHKLDERLLRIRQELVNTAEAGKGLTSQLATNTTPDFVLRISEQLNQNTQARNQLEREQAAVELQKLAFAALRKR